MVIDFKDSHPYWEKALQSWYEKYQLVAPFEPNYEQMVKNFCEYLRDNKILNIYYEDSHYWGVYHIEEDELLTLFYIKNDY